MPYQVSGLILKSKIGGQRTTLRLPDGATGELSLTPWTRERPWPSPGLEAYVVPGTLRTKHGAQNVILKVFKFDAPERGPRTRFLTDELRLGTREGCRSVGLPEDEHWKFRAFPFHWMSPPLQINGTELIGHLAINIGGDRPGSTADFLTYKTGERSDPLCWDHVTADERVALVRNLVDTVRIMESLNFVHGDLSHGNALIGPGPAGRRIATLCDFDAFYHQRVPMLPRTVARQPIRSVGVVEYMHPDLHDRFVRDVSAADGGLFVGTDRFALGVLVCEMMTWNSGLKGTLMRDTLLSEQEIKSRSLRGIFALAPNLEAVFPRGFGLLSDAMRATGMWSSGSPFAWGKAHLPGPDDWLKALQAPQTVTPAPRPALAPKPQTPEPPPKPAPKGGAKIVFISHSSHDAAVAMAIVEQLEARGIACFIAPRDIADAEHWSIELVRGINETRAMVVLLSDKSNESREVLREVQHADKKLKTLVPLRLADVEPAGGLDYYLTPIQWIDYFRDRDAAIERMRTAVLKN